MALKLCQYAGKRPPISQIAAELFMSASEVHAAIKRAQAAHLLHGPEMQGRPNSKTLEEFLVHGLKYAFPPHHGGLTRGLATSYAAEPLCRYISLGNEPPPVWPSAGCATVKSRDAALLKRKTAIARFIFRLLLCVDWLMGRLAGCQENPTRMAAHTFHVMATTSLR